MDETGEQQPTILPVNGAAVQGLAHQPAARPLRIVIPGGSGQVGRVLARHLQGLGHRVTVLTRGPYTANWQTVHWDGANPGPWTETLEGADACINLTGHTINCRHNAANRQAIYESRIGATLLLHKVIAHLNDPPKVWMNASADTLYARPMDANGVDLPLGEDGPLPEGLSIAGLRGPGAGEPRWMAKRNFMTRTVCDWEAAFVGTETPQTRKVILRSAVAFSPVPGNVFAVLSNLARLGLGGAQGNGRQFMTWIHELDYARAVEFLLSREDLSGPFNFAAPNPIPNKEFMAALRQAWGVPNGLPAPALGIMIGSIFLRTEPELVLKSCRAVPQRLLDAGFQFTFPHWAEAAEELVERWRRNSGSWTAGS